jgi:hypothetical protein
VDAARTLERPHAPGRRDERSRRPRRGDASARDQKVAPTFSVCSSAVVAGGQAEGGVLARAAGEEVLAEREGPGTAEIHGQPLDLAADAAPAQTIAAAIVTED